MRGFLMSTLLMCAAFGMGASAAAAGDDGIDYQPFFTAEYVTRWIDQAGLKRWQDPEATIGPKFVELRNDFVKTLREGAGKAGVTLPAGELSHPAIHRMIFNLFDKKGMFLRGTSEQVAFMAKVLLDLDVIRWVEEGGSVATDSGKAFTQRVPTYPYNLNCNGFIKFCCYMAGLPPCLIETVPSKDRLRIAPHFDLLNPARILDRKTGATGTASDQGYQGWFKPAYGGPEGWPYSTNAIAMKPGDLLVMYWQLAGKQTLLQWRTPGSFQFFHVEVVTRPDQQEPTNTVSIGNSGKKPHVSYLLGKRGRFLRWFDENWPLYVNYEKTAAWKIVVYQFIDRFRDGTVPPVEKLVLE